MRNRRRVLVVQRNKEQASPNDGGKALARLLGQLPEDPVRRGREFERLCKWLLENDPVYRWRLKNVWLWDRWPGRWGRDAGIDLVAEERDGTLWAIQAKGYDPGYPIKKEDVDTFLSESARAQFAYRLIVATTDRIGPNARQVLDGQQIPVGTLLRGDLMAAPVTWPKSLTDLRPARLRSKKPRPHQGRAVRDVVKGLEEHDRGQLVMACGTGKTLTSLYIAEALQAQRILILVPSLSLLSQVITEWTANSASPLDYIAVCSDESVIGEDELVSRTSDLPFPVTTNPADIARHLRSRGSSRKVIFSTYQSSERVAEAMRESRVPTLDLVVADEAHRLVGRSDRVFASVLRDDEIRARKRLFMTATPRRFTGRIINIAREKDLEVASMDDESLFGPRLHTLTFGEAISKGLLSDYRVAIIGIDDRTFHDWVEEGVLVQGHGLSDMDARALASHIGLAKASRRFDLRRAISFHGRVKRARTFAEQHPEVLRWMPARERPHGSIHADFISGEMPAGQRRLKIDLLLRPPADRALLANARCLTEGIDVPALDGVAFVDPRRSDIDIVQAVGRAIRLSPDKTLGTIVVPVFVGAEGDLEAALTSSAFRPAWDVLNALRSHDEELAGELDSLRQQLGRVSAAATELPTKIVLDLPSWVDSDFSRAIRVQVVEHTTSGWERGFGLLLEFVSREGHARVPMTQGSPVAAWVNKQRWRREGMSPERRRRLEELPGWTWDVLSDDWERALTFLTQFIAREGHARVPNAHREGDLALGTWVAHQRTLKRRGELDAEREGRLSALPGWIWDPYSDDWESAFELLSAFARREGHARVPGSYKVEGVALGLWVFRQRSARDRMNLDKKRRLESLPGWVWDQAADDWERAYALLLVYASREGHARVPQRHLEAGYRLGQWTSVQRTARAAMVDERRRRLERVPGWSWDSKADAWEESFTDLLAFVESNGHARVPARFRQNGRPLGAWVSGQRLAREELDLQRRDRLAAVPGWTWDPLGDDWERGYAVLSAYVEREGHALVPTTHIEMGFPLGRWVFTQRRAKDKMSLSRSRRLEALPGWKWRLRARGDQSDEGAQDAG